MLLTWLIGTMACSKKSPKKQICKVHSMCWPLFEFGGPFGRWLLPWRCKLCLALSEMHCLSHTDLYQIIHREKIQMAFPNAEAILLLFLSLMVTHCSGERSFSRLKRIKNELRVTMSQERLSALSILYTERDILRETNFNELIDDFAVKKTRKKYFNCLLCYMVSLTKSDDCRFLSL